MRSRFKSVLIPIFLTACAAGDDADPRGPLVVRWDSGGIRIVENAAPSWRRGRTWRVDSVAEVVIGSTALEAGRRGLGAALPDPIPLEQVRSVNVLSDGRIVVADGGPAQVLVFDTAGRPMTRFGGRGDGPGEFPAIVGTHVCRGDSIVVESRFAVHVFDDRGTYARRAQFRSGGQASSLEAVSTTCERVLIQQGSELPELGSWGSTRDVFAWRDPVSQVADTVAEAGLLEAWVRWFRGVERPFVVPWGTSRSTHAVYGDALVVGYARVPELRWYAPTGRLESIVRWAAEPQPVRRADRRHYSDVRAAWLAGRPDHPEVRFLFPELDEFPGLPSHKPFFDRVLVDDEGGAWVRAFPRRSLGAFDARVPDGAWSNQRWSVFDSSGIWLGELTLPDRFDLRAVSRGRLYGIVEDSLGVETVQVFEILGRDLGTSPTAR